MRAGLRFTSRASDDWKRIEPRDRARLESALATLREVPRPKKLDDRPLEGAAPWRRIRVGERRIIFRPFTQQEKALYGAEVGYIVDRIIDRRDLERAMKTLR